MTEEIIVEKVKLVYLECEYEKDRVEVFPPLSQTESKIQNKSTSSLVSRSNGHKGRYIGSFKATAYDDTVASQGKWLHKTATGFNLQGHTLESARCIAVDPKVIPLKSKVYIVFPEPYTHLNAIYTALDTGSVIKGNHIDVFFGGDNAEVKKAVFNFGIRQVDIYSVK